MSSERNIIKVYFKGTHLVHSKTQYQYNHGMILHFADLNLPQAFEVHFANKQNGNSKTMIGSENKVEIPDEYFWSGADEIYAWVYLHSDVDDGETVYEVRIPLVKRAKPIDEEPLPEQESTINRAIAELNHAVEQTSADAEQTSADREAVTALRDEVIDLKDEAEQSAQTATAKANEASESASSASESEQNANNYANDAKRYAESAFSSKEIAVANASDAEQAKEDAEQARDDAQDVRSDTIQLKQEVVGLKDDVTNLKDNVVNLKDDVIDLKEQTDTNVAHYPKIVDEYWHVWDARQNNFVNTGVGATGEDGEKGDKGDTGNSGVYIGTDEPTDTEINVWIDTDGQPDTIGLKYIKDDPSDNGGVIEGLVELPEDAPPSTPLNSASGRYAHAEGMMTTSSSDGSHAEGINTTSSNYGTHSEGYGTTASGLFSHAEGQQNTSSGNYSHAEGNGCVASAESAHAEGYHTMSQGYASHSEGDGTVAYGFYSHSEGKDTEAGGYYSHTSGNGTIARGQGQFVIGEYNIEQGTTGQKVNTDCAFIVGNGTDGNSRSNAYTLDWSGNGVFAGKVTVGAQPTNANDLTTKQYVDNAMEDLNSIATIEAEQTEVVLNKSDLDTSYDSTYVNEGYIGDNGKFTASSDYRSYYLTATEDLSVYVTHKNYTGFYLSIAVYSGAPSISTFIARYRSSDSNLPTADNRLSINTGRVLVLSIAYSSQQNRDFDLYTGKYTTIGSEPVPTVEFMSAINARIDKSVGVATKTATSLTVVIGGKIKYEVNKYSNSTIRAYLWRTNACYVLGANNTWQTVWKDSDSDGVVKISGEDDFIGGYHGDETQTLFKLFVDGTEYADTDTFEDVSFNEITIFAYSDVYHCNTSETPDVVAFKRSKIIKFNKNGYTVENKWTAQKDLTLEIAHIGMLSVQKALIQAYTNNSNYYCYTSLNGTNRLSDMTEAEFVLPYGTIGIAVSNYTQPTTYSGIISAYTERLKAYLSTINSSSHGAIANGGVIRGKAVTYFRG